jgi:hypothetical protein
MSWNMPLLLALMEGLIDCLPSCGPNLIIHVIKPFIAASSGKEVRWGREAAPIF